MTLATEPAAVLPVPHYRQQASDPEWMKVVVQFHGHLGPAVIAGARVGMSGLRAVGAKGYFDIEVNCEGPMAKPPQSCFLDGLQIATGATLGKRSLHWKEAQQVLVRFKNTVTGKTAELSLTPALLDLMPAFGKTPKSERAQGDSTGGHVVEDHLEFIARRIAAVPEQELVVVKAK